MAAEQLPRLRQVALIARDLDWTTRALGAALDTRVVFRDPNMVANFGGIHNALLAVGADSFIEVVAPLESSWDEAGGKGTNITRLLEKPGADTGGIGFMLILQVEDIAATTQRLKAAGARTVAAHGMATAKALGHGGAMKLFDYKAGESLDSTEAGQAAAGLGTGLGTGTCSVQWHPADLGVLVETGEARPRESWQPAGNSWPGRMGSSSVCGSEGFAGATVAVKDPATVAKRWAAGLGLLPPSKGEGDMAGEHRLQLGSGEELRFVPPDSSGRTGLVSVDIHGAAAGQRQAFGEIEVLGVRWRLVPPTPAMDRDVANRSRL